MHVEQTIWMQSFGTIGNARPRFDLSTQDIVGAERLLSGFNVDFDPNNNNDDDDINGDNQSNDME